MTKSENRRAENEVVFKQRNDAVKNMAKSLHFVGNKDVVDLMFTCECSNEQCDATITLTMQEYETARRNNRTFLVVPGHEDLAIEKPVAYGAYETVEKFEDPPTTDGNLNDTRG